MGKNIKSATGHEVMARILVKIMERLKSAFSTLLGFRVRTWHVEAVCVAGALSIVAIWSGKGMIEWLGVAAVFFTWMHASVAHRLAEVQAEKEAKHTMTEVECHRWTGRYFYLKEVLWFCYFIVLGAWSALAGTVLFLLYGWWRKMYRKYHPRAHG